MLPIPTPTPARAIVEIAAPISFAATTINIDDNLEILSKLKLKSPWILILRVIFLVMNYLQN